MAVFDLRGGKRLSGEVRISGAKNSVLPLLAATVLFREPCLLHNCPNLSDVDAALEILRHLGCRVKRQGGDIMVDSFGLNRYDIPRGLMEKMRSSVFFLGPLLGRFGKARMYAPGGCCLGDRPIDLHLMGLQALGTETSWEEDQLVCQAKALQGGAVTLPFPSVGATENLMLAAMGARETVTIFGAAREPEIVDLAEFLKKGGGKIYGAGTGMIQIEGGDLHEAEYQVMPDRIEAATYLCAVASAGGEALLREARVEDMRSVCQILQRAGCGIRKTDCGVAVAAGRLKSPGPVRTAPYPGFPTDAQAPVMAALLKAAGTTVFEENIFSNRFRHVKALRDLGGKIAVSGSIAAVSGTETLEGAYMEATDLRGGAAMVVAALGAEGPSTVGQIQHILRGYDRFPEKLQALGAEITTTNEPDMEETYGYRRAEWAGERIPGSQAPDPGGIADAQRPAGEAGAG